MSTTLEHSPSPETISLGEPIPNDTHAVSVSLPYWEDVVGYEEAQPRVVNAMKLGYPRFVYHPLVKKLFAAAESRFAGDNEFCLVFPSEKVAKQAVGFCGTGKVNGFGHGIFAVTLPTGLEKKAKEFWMHAGFIVSSRQAEDVLGGSESKVQNSVAKEEIKTKLSSLSGAKADDVYLYPSGMAAIFAAFEIAGEGNTVQLGFPYVDTLKIQEKFGRAVFINYKSAADLPKLEAELKNGAKAVFTEFPLNPLLTCVELDEVSRLCRQYGAALVVDDTLASWANVNVLEYADIAVTSLTKFFSGVGNVLAGSLVLNAESPLYGKLKTALSKDHEDLLYPADAEVLARNCRNYGERIKKINANAEMFHVELLNTPNVKNVYYTKDNPVYDKYKKPDGGYGGIISVEFETAEQARDYYNNLTVKKGPSLGTNYTLACPYTMLAHYYERDFAESCGVPFHLIRFSVGAE